VRSHDGLLSGSEWIAAILSHAASCITILSINIFAAYPVSPVSPVSPELFKLWRTTPLVEATDVSADSDPDMVNEFTTETDENIYWAQRRDIGELVTENDELVKENDGDGTELGAGEQLLRQRRTWCL